MLMALRFEPSRFFLKGKVFAFEKHKAIKISFAFLILFNVGH